MQETLVSSMTAQRIWVLCMAILRLFKVSWWYSWVPCEKLNLATFIPARRSFSIIGTDREAGPKVQTILVLRIRPSSGSSFKIPSMSMLDIFFFGGGGSDLAVKNLLKLKPQQKTNQNSKAIETEEFKQLSYYFIHSSSQSKQKAQMK